MEQKDYRLAAILYTDIAGFSNMMEKDEARTLKLLATHNALIEEIVKQRGGSVIKRIGDGFLIDFRNTVDALHAAIDIQNRLYEFNTQNRDLPLLVRIGVHLGDIYFYENDALGEGIDIAARLESIAHPGCICMSQDVYSLVLNKVDFAAEKMGRVSLKNITKEIQAYEIASTNVEFDSARGSSSPAGNCMPERSPEGEAILNAVSRLTSLVGKEVADGLDQAIRSMEDSRSRRENRHAGKAERHRSRDERRGRRQREEEAEPTRDWDEYRKKIRRDADGLWTGFWPHLASFIAVNGGLMFINLQTGRFPWALFPLGGWGIGLLEHLANALLKGEARRDLDRLPALDADMLSAFQKLQKHKEGFWHQLVSTIATSAFLIMIGSIIPAATPWIWIPVAVMGMGLFGHLAGYLPKKAALERSLREAVGSLAAGPAVDLGEYASYVAEAREARASILALAGKRGTDGKKNASPIDDSFLPTLDSYVEQVVLLASRNAEVDRIIEMIPMDELSRDKEELKAKMAGASGETLKREYGKSLGEIEKQETAFAELKEQREILALRMRSSVNTLKQMRIDLARLDGLSGKEGAGAEPLMKQKTEELRCYLEDLKSAYGELDEFENGVARNSNKDSEST